MKDKNFVEKMLLQSRDTTLYDRDKREVWEKIRSNLRPQKSKFFFRYKQKYTKAILASIAALSILIITFYAQGQVRINQVYAETSGIVSSIFLGRDLETNANQTLYHTQVVAERGAGFAMCKSFLYYGGMTEGEMHIYEYENSDNDYKIFRVDQTSDRSESKNTYEIQNNELLIQSYMGGSYAVYETFEEDPLVPFESQIIADISDRGVFMEGSLTAFDRVGENSYKLGEMKMACENDLSTSLSYLYHGSAGDIQEKLMSSYLAILDDEGKSFEISIYLGSRSEENLITKLTFTSDSHPVEDESELESMKELPVTDVRQYVFDNSDVGAKTYSGELLTTLPQEIKDHLIYPRDGEISTVYIYSDILLHFAEHEKDREFYPPGETGNFIYDLEYIYPNRIANSQHYMPSFSCTSTVEDFDVQIAGYFDTTKEQLEDEILEYADNAGEIVLEIDEDEVVADTFISHIPEHTLPKYWIVFEYKDVIYRYLILVDRGTEQSYEILDSYDNLKNLRGYNTSFGDEGGVDTDSSL